MPANSRKLNASASDSTENQVPEFNPDALRSLTEKIESNLKGQVKGAISTDTSVRPKTKTPNVKKKSGENTAKAPVSKSAIKIASHDRTATGKQKPTVAPKTTQGTKRLRDGRVKQESYRTKGDDVNTIKLGSRISKIGSDNNTNIDEELIALGGTKEDVDLIADLMSESEMEGQAAGPDKILGNGFEKEILQLVRQLGVDRIGKREMMADSGSEEANKIEDLKGDRNFDTTSSDKVTTDVKPALKTASSVGKGQRSLVSNRECQVFNPSDMHADFGLCTVFRASVGVACCCATPVASTIPKDPHLAI